MMTRKTQCKSPSKKVQSFTRTLLTCCIKQRGRVKLDKDRNWNGPYWTETLYSTCVMPSRDPIFYWLQRIAYSWLSWFEKVIIKVELLFSLPQKDNWLQWDWVPKPKFWYPQTPIWGHVPWNALGSKNETIIQLKNYSSCSNVYRWLLNACQI